MIDDVLGEFGEVCHRRRPQLMHKIAADDGWSEGTSRRILGQGCVSHPGLLRGRPGAACHDMRAYSKFKVSQDPGIYAQRPSSGADKSWGSRPVGRSKKWINWELEGAEAGPKTRICTGYAVKPS